MADREYRSIPLTFERGMIEAAESSMVPPGSLVRSRNWVPEPGGNLRARVGWNKTVKTGGPTTPAGWGIGHLAKPRRPYRVQKKTGTNTWNGTSGTVSATWDVATTAGNLLIMKVGGVSVSDTVTITPPGGWILAKDQVDTYSSFSRAAIYYKANAASESSQVSVTISSGTSGYMAGILELTEVANIVTSSPLDQTQSATANNTATGSTGTTAATTLVVEWATTLILSGDDNSGVTGSGETNSFTEVSDFSVDNGTFCRLSMQTYEKVLEATGTQGHQNTLSASQHYYDGVIATFKAKDYALTDGYYTVAHNAGSSVVVYSINRANLAAGTWSTLETVSVSPDVVPVAFTSGLNNLFYTHLSFAELRRWGGPGSTPQGITGTPAGRCVAFHKNRVFVGGNTGEPWKLWYGAPNVYDTITGYLEINKGDGEAIEDIAPFSGTLLIGKQTSLYAMSGAGTNASVQILPAGGAAPGRTIMPTPYGAVVAGRKYVWLVSGDSVDVISRPIESSYGMTGTFMSIAYLYDTAYICDQGSGVVWAINLRTGVWWEERISDSNEVPAVVYNQDEKFLFTPKSASLNGLLGWRLHPGSARVKDFDTMSEVYEAWTPEIWPVGPEQTVTPRRLFLKLRQRGGTTGDTGLTVTPYYDGVAQTAKTVNTKAAAGVFRWRGDLGPASAVSSVQFRITQTLPSTKASVFDIEEAEFGFDIEQVR